METPTTAIEFGSVVKKPGYVTAVDGAAFPVSAGEQVALLGPSGAGQSITVDLLLGLRTPDSGTIRLFGDEATAAMDVEARHHFWRSVARIAADAFLAPELRECPA